MSLPTSQRRQIAQERSPKNAVAARLIDSRSLRYGSTMESSPTTTEAATTGSATTGATGAGASTVVQGAPVTSKTSYSMTAKTAYAVSDDVAVLRLDDGKANAVNYDTLAAIDSALDDAEEAADALVITGRQGRFSAGFDLAVISESPEAARGLVAAGARTAMRLYGARIPVVAACTGHALAFGAIMLLAADIRIGADVDAKIGLIEVSIGMPLPVFAVELARDRLDPLEFTAATSLAKSYSPSGAATAGYLDKVVPDDELHDAAMQQAAVLADHVQRRPFALTRLNTRQRTIDHVLSTLDDDMQNFGLLD
ncbi:MAG: crotonase/enoyl-CoA hydratase family protein [Acidimicrobiaceae bacterium]|nr:crotonase/enoyl-CoA hydratase family protein [Acidimicrobiaceae bacterium]